MIFFFYEMDFQNLFTLQSFSFVIFLWTKQGVYILFHTLFFPLKYVLKGRNGPSQFGRISLDVAQCLGFLPHRHFYIQPCVQKHLYQHWGTSYRCKADYTVIYVRAEALTSTTPSRTASTSAFQPGDWGRVLKCCHWCYRKIHLHKKWISK